MRTNIVIDDRLMQKAFELTGLKTKREIVQTALQALVRLHQQKEIRLFQGKLNWQGDIDAMRTDE